MAPQKRVFGSFATLTIGSILGAGLVAAPASLKAADHDAAHTMDKHAEHAQKKVEHHAAKAEQVAGQAQNKAEKVTEKVEKAEKVGADAKAARCLRGPG